MKLRRDGVRLRPAILPRQHTHQHLDWRFELVDMLIAAGTTGIAQGVITKRFQHHADPATIVAHMESLRAEHKLQRFIAPTGAPGRAPTTWRATIALVEGGEDHDAARPRTRSGNRNKAVAKNHR